MRRAGAGEAAGQACYGGPVRAWALLLSLVLLDDMTMVEIRRRTCRLKAEKADIERAIAALEELERLRLERGALLVPTLAVLELQRRERVWSDPPIAA